MGFGHLSFSSIFIAVKIERNVKIKLNYKNSIRFGKLDDQLGNLGSFRAE